MIYSLRSLFRLIFIRVWYINLFIKRAHLFCVKGMMTDNDFRFMANTVAGMLLSAQVMKPCNPSAEKGQTETFKEDAMFR